MGFWDRRVLVTGGGSFIGSHLVEALLEQGARVHVNTRARELLGWWPEVPFSEGLRRTIDWYSATKDRDEVRGYLDGLLTERPGATRSTGPIEDLLTRRR